MDKKLILLVVLFIVGFCFILANLAYVIHFEYFKDFDVIQNIEYKSAEPRGYFLFDKDGKRYEVTQKYFDNKDVPRR